MARANKSEEVMARILSDDYEISESFERLPQPHKAREFVRKILGAPGNRQRLILVEDFGDYRVFVELPGKKSEFDFIVWRFSPRLEPKLKIPTHVDLGEFFIELKKSNEKIGEMLAKAIFNFVHHRKSVEEVLRGFEVEKDLKRRVTLFFSTLKWIALQEDVNYPPPKLGSKYTLAVYVLLNNGFELPEVRRMLKF